MEDSIYFKNANQDCTQNCTVVYENCDGSCGSYTYELPLGYVNAYPIYPPIFLSPAYTYKDMPFVKIIRGMYKRGIHFFVDTDFSLTVGNKIKIEGDLDFNYFVKRYLKASLRRGTIYEIGRVDGGKMTYVDMEKFKKGKKIYKTKNSNL